MVLCLFCACQSKEDMEERIKKTYQTFSDHSGNDFIVQKAEQPQIINFEPLGIADNYSSVVGVVDTFMLVTGAKRSFLLSVYGLNSKKILFTCFNRGKAEGEGLSAVQVLSNGNPRSAWIFDGTGQRLLNFDLLAANQSQPYFKGQVNIPIDMRYARSLAIIDDSTFAASSHYRSDGRYYEFSATSSRSIGSVPMLPEQWKNKIPFGRDTVLAKLLKLELAKRPGYDTYALAYNRLARIEIFDNGKLKIAINGPDYFLPDFSVERRKDGFIDVLPAKDLRAAYTAVFATADYFYVAYSGESFQTDGADRVLVFDWEGNAVAQWKTNRRIYPTALHRKGNVTTMYGVNTNDQMIVKADVSIK